VTARLEVDARPPGGYPLRGAQPESVDVPPDGRPVTGALRAEAQRRYHLFHVHARRNGGNQLLIGPSTAAADRCMHGIKYRGQPAVIPISP
jgi:hypothetical protein